MIRYLLIFVSVSLLGCKPSNEKNKAELSQLVSGITSLTQQDEIDNINSLLLFSLVYDNWQSDTISWKLRRGYNIGALLVSPKNEPITFELNCVNEFNNSTQHAEVRLITKYLQDNIDQYNLKNFTIYTTLEPCAMCAGMITMVSVDRVVYGQQDHDYGHVFERLAQDNQKLDGYSPYPRIVKSQNSKLSISNKLEEGYFNYCEENNEKILAKYLASNYVKKLYESAKSDFLNYQVNYNQNKNYYSLALRFYKENTVKDLN